MRHHFPPPRRRPDWWPQDATWPPQHPSWSHTRRRFAGRIFFLFLVVTILACVGFITILGTVLHLAGRPDLTTTIPARGLEIVTIAVLVLLGGGLVFRAARRLATPMSEMLDAIDRLAQGDYTPRVREHSGPPEVRSTTQAFNRMAGRLQENEQQRRALLADISHELRTPLTVIQGNVEGLLEGIYPADETHLRAILNQTRQMERLIHDLRTLSLAESGQLRLEKQASEPQALIDETLAGFRDQAAHNGISFRLAYDADLPTLEVDPVRMGEVLANVLTNAIRFSPQGGTIEIACRMEEPHRTRLVLSIRDEGPGIPPEDLPRIFERFYKSADSGGSGLGLAIAKNLVSLHEGTIAAESPPGGGTTIEIRIPINREDPTGF